jgi:protein-tyrosine phosphatase
MILFICTGNIFRSMTAEYALRACHNFPYSIGSAGTEAQPQTMSPFVARKLLERGIDPISHRQRRLTLELLTAARLPVAMGRDHQEFILRNFGMKVPLFNQVCFGRDEPLTDVWEAVPDWKENRIAAESHITLVISQIFEAVPSFLANYSRFIEVP